MAEIASVGLWQEVRGFGWRVFDLADRLNDRVDARKLARLRKTVALASRHLAKRASAAEERLAVRETEMVFKRLCDAVTILDAIAAEPSAPHAIDASALAQEAAALKDRVYDLVG